ncbi:MAG: nuclear transport factor 2 family protein [Bacteroidales bacterium]
METISQREQVLALLKAIESGDSTPMSYVNPDKFTQHNLTAGDGVKGFGEMLASLATYPEPATVNTVRAFTDGDYVVAHSDYNLFGAKVGIDIFRFEDGRIVEHWDNLQEQPSTPNPSGHTMTDGATEITDEDKTAANKALVLRFAQEVLVDRNYQNLIPYFNGDIYIQHNPEVGDGLSNFGDTMYKWSKAGMLIQYDKIHKVLGEGNFVLLVSEGYFGKDRGVHTSFYDLFRVENNKIVEHWDVIEPILPDKEQKNSNGKFGF